MVTRATHADLRAEQPASGMASHGTRVEGAISYTVAPDVAPLWDDAAQQCVASFVEWLGRESRARHLPVIEAKVVRWQSFEDPRDEHVVIEADVQGDSATVATFWGAACDQLADLIGRHPTPAAERLTVGFHSR